MAGNFLYALGRGLQSGVDTYGRLHEQDLRQRELEAARAERVAERERQEQTDAIQRAILLHQQSQLPVEEARKQLAANVQLKGMEATLDDPAVLELAKRAGISLPTRELAKPGLTPTSWMTGEGATRENQDLFPHSGVVKPPEVIEKELEREQAIERAKAVTQMMRGLNTGGAGISSMANTPEGRLRARLLGFNGNDIWGTVREPIATSAQRAGAEAAAKLPYQMQLIDRAAGQRAGETGDPYFNAALSIFSAIAPPMREDQIPEFMERVKSFAAAAQQQQPRGQASVSNPNRPGGPKKTAAPTMDTLIAQAVKNFGSVDGAIAATDATAQQRLKAAGIDPAAYMRRLQAMKIMERLEGKKQ